MDADAVSSAEPKAEPKGKSKSVERQADTLVKAAKAGCRLVHTPDGDGYALIQVNGHREVHRLRSKQFRSWLAERYYRKHKRVPSSQAMADALTALEGIAVHEGAVHEVHVRLAEHEGTVYLDLCDPSWRCVEITPDGWRIVDEPPVLFRRPKAMRPLPEPGGRGGDVAELWRFVNVSEENRPLVLGWLVAAFYPRGPYPLLCLFGEAGAGKSWLTRLLRALVDANASPVRAEPKDARDLMIAANNGWVLALDNLSRVPPWLSDALCRLSTGGGFSTRTLYENDEETIFEAMRPLLVTSIEEVVTRGDLLDRALLVNLQPIRESERRPESELLEAFNEAAGRILGALLDALAVALKRLPGVRLDRLPRMADFARLAVAAEPALGLAPGEFMRAYFGNRASGHELALEASPVGKLLVEFMAGRDEWLGTSAELLEVLEGVADEKTRRLRSWPNTPRSLAGALKRLAPNLRAVGVEVESGRDKRHRWVSLRKDKESTVTTVTTVTEPENTGFPGDATGDGSGTGFVTTVTGDATGDAGDTTGDGRNPLETPGNDAGDANDGCVPTLSVEDELEEADVNEALAEAAEADADTVFDW